MSVRQAIRSLGRGGFVLVHDSESRENEFDMVVAAQHVTANHIAQMRADAGGLVCAAMEYDMARVLGLRYMHDMLADTGVPKSMILGRAPYGDHPTFSIPVNHHDTYTGVTDADRALTVSSLAALYGKSDAAKIFHENFRTPGHVPLLMASKGLLKSRMGHTELSVYLVQQAGLPPVSAICEMVDSETHLAADKNVAHSYAEKNDLPVIDAAEIAEYAEADS